uniref:CRAL-TRIO domain-containing protein n=1 Tax=Timema genevievae TaxID=629358 RepID=A0A7R9JQZ8_TIMGE|nr:unnamed protein product [Timema genevievae]
MAHPSPEDPQCCDPTLQDHIKTVIKDTQASLLALKKLLPTRPDIEFKRHDDEFLVRFLHARKCNIEDSFLLLVNYYLYRKRNPEIFVNLSLEEEGVRQALWDGFPGVLRSRDRKGRRILVLIAAHWDHCRYSLAAVYRSMLLSLEHLVEKPRNQLCGLVVIVDWSNFSYRQSSNLSPRLLRLIIEGLQDCFPASFKAVHFVGQPWYVEAALAVIRPFLKDRTKDRVRYLLFVHGNNLSSLHEAVPRDVLPPELGGEGPPFSPLQWAQQLMQYTTMSCKMDKATWPNQAQDCRTTETYTFDEYSDNEDDT